MKHDQVFKPAQSFIATILSIVLLTLSSGSAFGAEGGVVSICWVSVEKAPPFCHRLKVYFSHCPLMFTVVMYLPPTLCRWVDRHLWGLMPILRCYCQRSFG